MFWLHFGYIHILDYGDGAVGKLCGGNTRSTVDLGWADVKVFGIEQNTVVILLLHQFYVNF